MIKPKNTLILDKGVKTTNFVLKKISESFSQETLKLWTYTKKNIKNNRMNLIIFYFYKNSGSALLMHCAMVLKATGHFIVS